MITSLARARPRLRANLVRRWKHSDEGPPGDSVQPSKDPSKKVKKFEQPEESPDIPKKHAFQGISKIQYESDTIYTLQKAAEREDTGHMTVYFKYPKLTALDANYHYALRAMDNQYSVVNNFPTCLDVLIVGSGLVGSATAYYAKKKLTRTADVCVMDKDPHSPNNCTAMSNGLISVQSKCRDISRIANLTKELIRDLADDIIVTPQDLKQINYRPCRHLVLWREDEVGAALKAIDNQIEDGQYVESKLPEELERTFPFLKAVDTDITMGSHGCQDEAIIDPIGLRNLYRTLAQAYGANFVVGEVIEFNTIYRQGSQQLDPLSAACVVARNPRTGELRNVGYNRLVMCLGHNTPFLEARSEMESYERDLIGDLHFIQPKLRVHFMFQSLNSPVINFPAITDTDGSVLINEGYCGMFKYCLPYAECDEIFLSGVQTMDLDSENPYPVLKQKDKYFEQYFKNVIKPRLVKRIPIMEDAKFTYAITGFESCNTHDQNPVMGCHLYHSLVYLSSGYGPRVAQFGPAFGLTLSDLIMEGEEDYFDMTGLYWNRRVSGRKIDEFEKLVN